MLCRVRGSVDNADDEPVKEKLESCANLVSPGLLSTTTHIGKSCGKFKSGVLVNQQP